MTDALRAYLAKDAELLVLDEDDPKADDLRDEMDPLWLALSDEDHKWLRRRDD